MKGPPAMKAILVHDAAGRIHSVSFVADDAGYEPEPGKHAIEVDPSSLDVDVSESEIDRARIREDARRIAEGFQVIGGKVVSR
jgi:hypothetical protein